MPEASNMNNVEEKENEGALRNSNFAQASPSLSSLQTVERKLFNDSGLSNQESLTVVITGFGPFREHVINSSWEAAKLVPNIGIELPSNIKEDTPVHLISYLMPVEYKFIADIIPKIWENIKPDLLVHLGLSGLARAITLEKTAHNNGYCSPDVVNVIPTGNVCIPNGCVDVLETGFDMRRIVCCMNAMHSSGTCPTTAEVSYDPGRYLCDFIYYNSLHMDKERSAFIHVPPLNKPWDADDLATAIGICIREMLRQLQEKGILFKNPSQYTGLRSSFPEIPDDENIEGTLL